jgi:PAS domain S-box-containing protein
VNPILSPYVLILIAAGVVCACIAAYAWPQRRKNPETIPLTLLLGGITEWIAATAMGMLDQNLAHKMPWAQIEYIGVVSVPLMVLVFVLHHTGSGRRITARRLIVLSLIPAATLIAAWTNGSHGWIWARYVPYLEGGLAFSEKAYGPGFWVYWIYSYLLLLTATAITFRAMLLSANLFRWQNVLILIGILAPWAGNLLYVLRLDPLKNLDLTPLAFGITGMMLALGMFRWRLFDIQPIAQAAVIAGMADGVLILDAQDRIVDANSAAQAILGLNARALVGKPVEAIFAGRLPAGEAFPQGEEKSAEIWLTSGGDIRAYELTSSPFQKKDGSLGGRIIFLRDLTDRKRLERKLKDAEREQMDALLRQSENKYETLFHNMSVGVLCQRADGAVIDMNPAAEHILGVERRQLSDLASLHTALKTIHEDGSDFPEEEYPGLAALKTGRPLRNQMMGVYFPEEENYHWINIHAVPQFEPGKDAPNQAFVTFDDVTERKRAEEALQKSEKRLRDAQELAHLGFWTWDVKTGAVEWSEEVFKIFCLDPKEFTPQIDSILALSPWPEDHQRDQELIQRAIETRGPGSYEQKFLRPDNSIGHYFSTFQGSYDEKGDLISIFGTVLDITDRKRAEAALLETEQRLASIYDTVGDVIFLLAVEPDGQFRFISVNKSFGTVTGVPPDQVIGRKVSEIIPEPSLGTVLGNYRHAIEAKTVTRWEEVSEYPIGRLIGEVCVAPVFDKAGNCTHLVGSVHDITERKRAEEALRESEDKFKYVFDNSSVGKSVTFPGGEVHANKALCELLGYSPEELQNKNWREITHPADIELTQRELDSLLAGKKETARFNKRYLHKNGSIVWGDVSTSLRLDGEGHPLYFITTVIDVTAQKQIEEKLRYQASLLESANDAIVVSDAQYRLTDWNAAAETLYGWKAGEVLGQNGLELIRTEWPAAETEEMRRTIAEVGHWRGEATQQRKDGTRIPVEVSSMVLRDPSGRITGYISLNRDISERKRAEEEIALMAKFPSENPNPVLRLAHDGTVLYANDASKTLLAEWGSAVSQPASKSWRDAAAEALEKGASRVIETQSGGRTYSFFIAPVIQADYVNLYGRDETERKQVEEALHASEEKYRLIADNADDWIYLTAPDRTILYASPSCERVSGYTPKEFIDNSELLTQIVHPEDKAIVDGHLAETQNSTVGHELEYRIVAKSGGIRWLNHSCIAVCDDAGQIIGRRGNNRDITERKHAEEALQNTLADLERSNKELEQFAYVASHDLQEPLRMVSSYTQLLARRYQGKLGKDADEFIAYAVDGANNMQRLINDLLAYSRVGTRGKPPAHTPAGAALDRALENLKLAVEESGAEISRGALPSVAADEGQLSQLFQNLVANAIKFRGEKPPKIRIECEPRGKEWIFSVRDNGIGIDPQYFDRIFIIFQRLHERGKYPGTGIGLAVCKKIVQRHGGRIWVESEPGQGATFHFSLPRTEEDEHGGKKRKTD